ncbi:MAG: hypothetical protein ACI9UN_003593 [Granulosicoccus sp.]|jgi:hypothetical protein
MLLPYGMLATGVYIQYSRAVSWEGGSGLFEHANELPGASELVTQEAGRAVRSL